MWFGNIVTMKWWDNVYLNEGIVWSPRHRKEILWNTNLNPTVLGFATLVSRIAKAGASMV